MAGRFQFPLPFGMRGSCGFDAASVLADIRRRAAAVSPSGRRRLLTLWGAIARQDFREQFSVGGKPSWKALAPSTVAAKQAAGLPPTGKNGRVLPRLKQNGTVGPANILIATGKLRDSYVQASNPDHIEEINEATGTLVEGSKNKLAMIHQQGTRPYMIQPKTARALAFMADGGRPIVRRLVNHPGLAARPVTITDQAIARMRDATDQHVGEGDIHANPDQN